MFAGYIKLQLFCGYTIWWGTCNVISHDKRLVRIIIIIIIIIGEGHRVGSGVHPRCYPEGTEGSFPTCKAARAWHWPLTSLLGPKLRTRWAVCAFLIRLHGVVVTYRKKFTFTLIQVPT